jgi:hypothetical protein
MIRLTTAILIISLLITSLSLYGQRTEARYELGESETFAGPINNWLLPTKKPIIAIEKNQVRWLGDTKTDRLTLPEGTVKVVFSKGMNYFGILSLGRVPANAGESGILNIEIYAESREKLYEIKRNYHYDDPLPCVAISDLDGSLIIGQNATGEVEFYNSSGSIVSTVELFSDGEYDLERTLHIDLSKDGMTAAIVAGKRGASPRGSNAPHPSAEPNLFLYSPKGEEFLRKPLPDFSTSATSISNNGEYIAISSYTVDVNGDITKRTIILDNTGKEIGQVSLLSKLLHFSSDSEFLVLADKKTAVGFDLTAQNAVWSYEIPKSEEMIAAVDVSNEGQIAALLVGNSEFKDGTFIFSHPQIEILNQDGNLLQELKMTREEFEKPALNLSDDSERIFVGFRNAYQIYQVKK